MSLRATPRPLTICSSADRCSQRSSPGASTMIEPPIKAHTSPPDHSQSGGRQTVSTAGSHEVCTNIEGAMEPRPQRARMHPAVAVQCPGRMTTSRHLVIRLLKPRLVARSYRTRGGDPDLRPTDPPLRQCGIPTHSAANAACRDAPRCHHARCRGRPMRERQAGVRRRLLSRQVLWQCLWERVELFAGSDRVTGLPLIICGNRCCQDFGRGDPCASCTAPSWPTSCDGPSPGAIAGSYRRR